MDFEMNTSFSTQDNDNSSISCYSICDYSSEGKIVDGIIDILNLLVEQNKGLKNYLKLVKKQEKSIFSMKSIPTISLKDYLERVISYSKIENNTLITSLIYIDRLCQKTKLILTPYNMHRIIFTSILLSLKYNEDLIYNFSFYSKIAGINVKELKKLESEFVKLINFSLYVETEQFEKYKQSLIGCYENL
jgi:hypothetical protein